MAVTKLTMSGFTPSTFNKYDDFLAGNAAYDPAATWLISSATGTGSSNTITFSSIPQNYKHLQIRGISRDTYTAAVTTLNLTFQFNSDTATNYSYHQLIGDGSTASASGAASTTGVVIQKAIMTTGAAANTTTYGATIVDILDYSSTSKNKTVKTITGADYNTASTNYSVRLTSGLWVSTSAITSISIVCSGTAFATGTKFSLYGFTG